MDKAVNDRFLDHLKEEPDTGELEFLLDEGLDLLANYAKVSDVGVRKALFGLVDALARARR